MNILLVDDDVFVCAYLRHVLTRQGHEVVECSNGIEAMAEVSQRPFDLAVVDGVMPGMDGVALVKRLKKEYPELPILAISGGAGSFRTGGVSYLELMADVGADQLLEKPFDEVDFLSAVISAAAVYLRQNKTA